MAKRDGQRGQHDGCPHPECTDVRKEQSGMTIYQTCLCFFHPSCAPFTFS